MADQYLYDETLDSQTKETPMVQKNMFYVQDQNGGSYNGQITFDTSVLSNSRQWLAYSEAYIEIPFQISMAASAITNGAAINAGAAYTAANAFMAGLKNGHYQLIDSIQVDYNNKNIIALQPFTNFFVNYKLMSSMSGDDLKKWGPSIGFYPDSAGSSSYATATNANGEGTSNNVVNPASSLTYQSQLEAYNEGFLKRLQQTSFSALSGAIGYGGNPEINSTGLLNTIAKNYAFDNGIQLAQTGNAPLASSIPSRTYNWNILATIRLKDIADFFDKIPLIKGAFFRFTINYNSATTILTATNAPSMITSVVTQLSGRTNPIMLPSAAANNPLNAFVSASAAGNNIIVSCGVVKAASNSNSNHPITSCRLYVPAYLMNPTYESQLITVQPKRKITYTDIYNFNITNIAGDGASFNSILTNGIVNPKYVVVMPFLSGTTANTGLAVTASPYQSVFDSAPGTTSPLAAITQFQVQVGGQNMFQQSEQYDFEAFMNEMSSINAINGGASTGLTSGLIGHYEWDNAYRYYVCDISRRVPAEDQVPKSVVVQGINNTSKSMDYICFIVYERSIYVDLVTGGIVDA